MGALAQGNLGRQGTTTAGAAAAAGGAAMATATSLEDALAKDTEGKGM